MRGTRPCRRSRASDARAISCPGCGREPRIEDALDRLVAVEERRDPPRVLAVALHPESERLQAAQHEPGVERARHGAQRLLQERQPLGDRRVVRGDDAADDVAVAAEVLRRRVDDGVGAELERQLEVRRRERVVDDEQRADRVRGVGRARGCRRRSGAGSTASRPRRAARPRRGGRTAPRRTPSAGT